MYSADFPLQFQAGLHARPLGHLTNLGLTIDGKRMSADNPEMAEYEMPHSTPDRVVRVAANTGDPDHDRRLVQYAKATIQSGDGPFRHVVHPMSPAPEHVAGAMQALEADPNWQPYIKVARMLKEAPGNEHMKGVSPKRNRQYEHIKDSLLESGKSEEEAKEEAARTVNKQRSEHGETKKADVDPNTGRPYYYAPDTQLVDSQGHRWVTPTGDTKCPQCGEHGESAMSKSFHDRNIYDGEKWVDRPQRNSGWHEVAFGDAIQTIMTTAAGLGIPISAFMAQEMNEAFHGQTTTGNGGYITPDFILHWLESKGYGRGYAKGKTPERWLGKTADWHEVAGPMQQYQQDRGDFAGAQGTQGTAICPNCGTLNQAGAQKCAKCGTKLALPHPSMSGGPSNAYSNPYTGNPPVTGAVTSEMSKWHLADLAAQAPGMQQQPDTVDGPFNDHRDVSEMSPEQSQGHERLVNIVVDEMNKVISGGGAVDATLINNLVQWLVDKFGQDADSAQAIVDAATKQAQTSDGRLDNTPVVPDPAEQAIQPAQGDVVSDPSQVQNQGAFSHVRTPSGKIGHVTEQWEDMYGEKWAMVATVDGARESVYADELEETTSPDPENAVEELQAFIQEMEPVEARVASIKARIANMRILKQEIRRHMSNPRLSMEQRLALDQMDADASVEMLELTDAVPQLAPAEQAYLDSQPRHDLGYVEDQPPTMFGASEIEMPEAAEPEWTNEALDAYLPEEAEIMVSELPAEVRSDPTELAAVAAAHVDKLTAGHAAEVRAHHRDRFVAAARTVAADYSTTDEADTNEPESQDWDGPAEAIFAGEM